NSTLIAHKHYLQTTEEDFRRAAKSGAGALQKAVQHSAARHRTESQESSEGQEACEVVREGATGHKLLRDEGLRPEGFEPPTYGSVGHLDKSIDLGRTPRLPNVLRPPFKTGTLAGLGSLPGNGLGPLRQNLWQLGSNGRERGWQGDGRSAAGPRSSEGL